MPIQSFNPTASPNGPVGFRSIIWARPIGTTMSGKDGSDEALFVAAVIEGTVWRISPRSWHPHKHWALRTKYWSDDKAQLNYMATPKEAVFALRHGYLKPASDRTPGELLLVER
jgi:hypothetical protein